ncbi:MAG: hypothetical protein AAFY76_03230 [Cyanobacteria bacterium J06649_11]
MRLCITLILTLTLININAQSNNNQEPWVGLNNIFYKSKDVITSRLLIPSDSNIVAVDELIDHQLSLGLFFRRNRKDNTYYQIDFSLNRNRYLDATVVEKTMMNGATIIEPTRGQEIKTFNTSAGYRKGKTFRMIPKLYIDVGVRGSIWYQKENITPVTAMPFPLENTSFGIGLSVIGGFNYQVFDKLIIGYNLTPISIIGYWNREYVDNRVLTDDQKINTSVNFDSSFFESTIDLRNILIAYIF